MTVLFASFVLLSLICNSTVLDQEILYGSSHRISNGYPFYIDMNRATATETVNSGSIPGWVTPKTRKLVFIASILDVQQLKGPCEATTMCGRQVAA